MTATPRKQFKWKRSILVLVLLFPMASCIGGISCISIHLGGGGCLGEELGPPDEVRPIGYPVELHETVGAAVRALY